MQTPGSFRFPAFCWSWTPSRAKPRHTMPRTNQLWALAMRQCVLETPLSPEVFQDFAEAKDRLFLNIIQRAKAVLLYGVQQCVHRIGNGRFGLISLSIHISSCWQAGGHGLPVRMVPMAAAKRC